jgi:hypothetical protein
MPVDGQDGQVTLQHQNRDEDWFARKVLDQLEPRGVFDAGALELDLIKFNRYDFS